VLWDQANSDARDCVLTNGGYCDKDDCNKQGFKVKNNFVFSEKFGGHDLFPPIFDDRWHSETMNIHFEVWLQLIFFFYSFPSRCFLWQFCVFI
jgi:hypothetical protein